MQYYELVEKKLSWGVKGMQVIFFHIAQNWVLLSIIFFSTTTLRSYSGMAY